MALSSGVVSPNFVVFDKRASEPLVFRLQSSQRRKNPGGSLIVKVWKERHRPPTAVENRKGPNLYVVRLGTEVKV